LREECWSGVSRLGMFEVSNSLKVVIYLRI
jgi:hypothetical protein